MTRARGELPEPEEQLLGIERLTPEQEAELEDRQKKEHALERDFLRRLMEQDMFRKWLMKKLLALSTFERAFGVTPTGFPDARSTDYQLGLKAAGWDLWCEFDNAAPELASRMRRELAGT